MKKKCKLCESEFETSRTDRLFCSPQCNVNHKNWKKSGSLLRLNLKTGRPDNNRDYVCRMCSSKFRSTSGVAVLCSDECRRKNINRNTVKWAEKYYSSTPAKYLRKRWQDIKNEVSRGVRNGITKFTLKEKDLFNTWEKQGGVCALSGRAMTFKMGEGMKRTNASVDRIDNSKGYTKSNVRLVCWMANVMRHKMEDDELAEWCVMIAGRWIHQHPKEAREHGWLCQPGEWNKQPNDGAKRPPTDDARTR